MKAKSLEKNKIKKEGKVAAKSEILDSVYSAAKDMHEIGVMDAVTLHNFESICKKPLDKLSPRKIKEIRIKEKVSQPVFAWYLNVMPTTVKKWERGENLPSGPALRLLNVIKKHGLEYIAN